MEPTTLITLACEPSEGEEKSAPRKRETVSVNARPVRNGRYAGDKGSVLRVTKETKVRLDGLPVNLTTQDLWDMFQQEGEIALIELYTGSDGKRIPSGSIRFNTELRLEFLKVLTKQGRLTLPVPSWGNERVTLRVTIDTSSDQIYQSPTSGRGYAIKEAILADSLSICVLCGPARVKTMETFYRQHNIPIMLTQNLRHRLIEISFPLNLSDKRVNHYKIVLSHSSPMVVCENLHPHGNSNRRVIIIFAENVPEFSVKQHDRRSHNNTARTWSSQNAWYRKTDVPKDPARVMELPTSLRKFNSRLDLGRWRVYRLDFELSDQAEAFRYSHFCQMLEDFNIPVRKDQAVEFVSENIDSVWKILDEKPTYQTNGNSTNIDELGDLSKVYLPFDVRYQLEVCLSEGWLNEFTLTRQFVETLRDIGNVRAVNFLSGIATNATRIFDPMELLSAERPYLSTAVRKVPSDFHLIRSALVTPTTIYFHTPALEISNRVIRQFSQYHDRFLRVRFAEERPKGKLRSRFVDAQGRSSMDEIYQRIWFTLKNGIMIGERHYEFLGFGNSQFREHGAYFFAAVEHLSAKSIRAWMGDFNHLKSPSKYAARLGQCFSTTRPVRGAVAPVLEIPDIWTADGKYNFTDGVGKISKPMAQIAATEMGIAKAGGEGPSVIQFRSGGSKGVLAVHENVENNRENRKLAIWIRPSQYKFAAKNERLEIIKWSQFASAHLNRQLILVLSTLGVPDDVFTSMMKVQLQRLDEAMTNERVATKILRREVDPNQTTLLMADLVSQGFQYTNEPFTKSLLYLWRAWSIKGLKEKAKIVVPKGAVLLGCIDELAVLQGHYDAKQPKSVQPTQKEKEEATPEVFVQLSDGPDGKPVVIVGYMLLARNPSLHPGDVRVVKGVDRTGLHHLKDVVVLPQTGDRDLASMCSGGDLDGDDYIVIWDQNLLPREWNYPPAEYMDLPERKLDRDVTVNDIMEFFVTYMKNNALSTIARAHMAMADYEPDGVKSRKCLKLTELHSQAVDYPKSGHPVQMDLELQPKRWPHFMETRSMPYRSRKVLGQLYDQVMREDFVPCPTATFDSRILGKFKVTQEKQAVVWDIKERYDISMRRIMAQYAISTEFEVFSTFVMSSVNIGTDYKSHEVIGNAAKALKETYSKECYEAAGGRDFHNIGPFAAAMYEVTWMEVTAFIEQNQGRDFAEIRHRPLISFPWLFHTELGKIANHDAETLQAMTEETARAESNRVTVGQQLRNQIEADLLRDEEGASTRDRKGSLNSGVSQPFGRAESMASEIPSTIDMSSRSVTTDARSEDMLSVRAGTPIEPQRFVPNQTVEEHIGSGIDRSSSRVVPTGLALENVPPRQSEDAMEIGEDEMEVKVTIPNVQKTSLLERLADM